MVDNFVDILDNSTGIPEEIHCLAAMNAAEEADELLIFVVGRSGRNSK
jgi:hypothetical protein